MKNDRVDFSKIRCVVFDFGYTLCSEWYFNVAPQGCPGWQGLFQEHIFSQPALLNQWMQGDLSLDDIAGMIAPYVDLDMPDILHYMRLGCQHLRFNPAVLDFAVAQRTQGRKTTLVTANMDVFTSVVVPAHHLERFFDVILNTSDCRELRKEKLWPLAFDRLGGGIGYGNSLLIEDGQAMPALFRKQGGLAYQYTDDAALLGWLEHCNEPEGSYDE